MVINWMDFGLFAGLLALFVYMIWMTEITALHKVYFLFHGAMMLWPIGQFGLSTTSDMGLQWFFLVLSFLGASFMGYGWWLFSLVLTQRANKTSFAVCALLAIPSIAAFVIVVTNPLHGAFLQPEGDTFVQRTYGPLFWYLVVISIAYILAGNIRMIRAIRSSSGILIRRQVMILIVGQTALLLISMLDVAISVIPIDDFPFHGLTSMGLLLSDVCFAVAILRYNVFKLVNIAQREVIDTMSTGILVLDSDDIVVDTNEAVKRMLFMQPGDRFEPEKLLEVAKKEGPSRQFIAKRWGDRMTHFQTEATIGEEPKRKHISVQVSPLFDQKLTFIGRVVTLNDVTEWRLLASDLHLTNEDLRQRNVELTAAQEELFHVNRKLEQLAITDSLTGCYNRRYLYQLLEYEITVEKRYEVPFSIVLFDVDYFKQVNDSFGHKVGDEVLKGIAEKIKTLLRKSDILARYGGEEFTIYLPHTTKENAFMLCERIRQSVELSPIESSRGDISVTISIGIASWEGAREGEPDDSRMLLDQLLLQADSALYRAKREGRNRVIAGDGGAA